MRLLSICKLSIKMALYSEPSNGVHWKCLIRILRVSTKRRHHRSPLYEMELIFKLKGLKQFWVSSGRKERLMICHFLTYLGSDIYDSLHGCSWACWAGNLLKIIIMKVWKPWSWTGLSYFPSFNVLHIWECPGHPTYRVYRLYDIPSCFRNVDYDVMCMLAYWGSCSLEQCGCMATWQAESYIQATIYN